LLFRILSRRHPRRVHLAAARGRRLDADDRVPGEVVATRTEGTALSVDPGVHVFTFEVPGHPPVERQLLVLEGEKVRHERIDFASAAEPRRRPARPTVPAAPPPGATPAVAPLVEAPAAPPPPSHEGLGRMREAGIAAGAVGVGGLAVGAIFGWLAISRRDAAYDVCPDKCPTQHGVDLWNSAASAGNTATVAFTVGVVGVATGAVLWLLGKPADGRW
jgi:hypothetical protein